MQYRYLAPPPLNPFARIVAGLVAVALLVGAFFFGLLIVVAAVGLGVVAWLVLAVRVWWLRRRLRTAPGDGVRSSGRASARPGATGKSDTIEGEYEVISRREDD